MTDVLCTGTEFKVVRGGKRTRKEVAAVENINGRSNRPDEPESGEEEMNDLRRREVRKERDRGI